VTDTHGAMTQPTRSVGFNRDQIELLKRTICKGSTDDEFSLFCEVAKRTGLDPFKREIHAVKRWDSSQQCEVMAIQTGIDGYRKVAHRQGNYLGKVRTVFYDAKGNESEVWLNDDVPPTACKVWSRKRGEDGAEVDIEGLAHLRGYIQRKKDGSPVQRWRTDAAGQLSKCAEAQSIRAGWSDLAGVYTDDEMAQASETLNTPTIPQPERASAQEAPATEAPSEGTGAPQGKPEPPGEIPTVRGEVAGVHEKKCKNGSMRYTIRIGSQGYSTFDQKVADHARVLEEEGASAILYWKQGEWGRECLELMRLESNDLP